MTDAVYKFNCVYVYVCILCMFVCMYAWLYVSLCMYVCVCVHVCISKYVCMLYLYSSLCVCFHVIFMSNKVNSVNFCVKYVCLHGGPLLGLSIPFATLVPDN